MKNPIRQFYFYTATLIFLIMSVIAAISLLNLGMKTYLFPKAEMAYSPCDMSYMRAPAVAPDVKQPTEEEIAAQQATCEKNQIDQRSAQRQNTLVQYLSMLIVAAPLFWLHFKWVQKERETELKMGESKA